MIRLVNRGVMEAAHAGAEAEDADAGGAAARGTKIRTEGSNGGAMLLREVLEYLESNVCRDLTGIRRRNHVCEVTLHIG